ncbi:MAG: gliding motility-associated C-terminal domain-containing protein [Bacteroidia bacterium]
MKNIFYTLFLFISVQSFSQSGCFEIQSILVDACAPQGEEGLNEMVRFQIGDADLNTADMNVTWATVNNAWEGVCQSAATAAIVDQLNADILGCGILVEPENGVLPANSQVLLVSSVGMDPNSNSFEGLNDTLYIIFHCATNTTGNFANYNSAGGPRTLNISFVSPGGSCFDIVTYDRGDLVNQSGNPGAEDGASVNFTADGEPDYFNNGCSAPFNSVVADWNAPESVCENADPIDLDALVTSNPGGTWTGEGVSGSTFTPSGLSGDISITYSVQVNTCLLEVTKEITVLAGGDASWDTPADLCSGSQSIDLTAFITGDQGGVFSGTGVANNSFDPSGLSGLIAVTYSVGAGSCASMLTHDINVVEGGDAGWAFASDVICQDADAIILDLLVSGETGGTWSGEGVSGNVFSPDGLEGAIVVVYTVEGVDCGASVSDTITVTPTPSAAWEVPDYICTTQGDYILNELVSGTPGGTWTGDMVSVEVFNSNGEAGSYTITYTVGVTGCGDASTQILTVLPAPTAPSITGSPNYCEGGPYPVFTSTAGANTSWFADSELTTMLGSGTTFQPATDANPVIYATGFSAGCISETAEIALNLIDETTLVTTADNGFDLCPGGSLPLSGITNNGNISWSTGSGAETIQATEPGTYIVTAAGFCNTVSDTVEINDAGITVSLTATPEEGPKTLDITVNGSSTNSDDCAYYLNNAEVFPDNNGILSIAEEGTYTLTYSCWNDAGCMAEASREITVLTDEVTLDFPNSFTPNGDGFNDFFKAQASALTNLQVTIFNRWGQQVATWEGVSGNWDGTSGSGEVPDGVYFYVADATDIFGNALDTKGSVTLLRK